MATIGQQFKTAREAKGVDEATAGSATNIMTKTIEALEADDFSIMAAPTYAKGFIRLYAGYLGIDPEPLVLEYIENHAPPPPSPGNSAAKNIRSTTPRSSSSVSPSTRAKPGGSSLMQTLRGGLASLPAGTLKDIRVVAALIAGLLILIALISSVSTCVRKPVSQTSTTHPSAPAPMLLDEPLPNLYRVEPGKIEASHAH